MTITIRGNKALTFFDSFFTKFFSPFQYGITHSVNWVKEVHSDYIDLINVKQENRSLKDEIHLFKEENNKFKEQILHYQRLLKLFDFKETLSKKTELAEVIGVDPSRWSKIVYVRRKDTASIIEKNMAVVTHGGLVGQIVHSTDNTGTVVLITDARSSVDALIQRTRSRGVVVGLNKDYCILKYVPVNDDIVVGDRVISTGLGGIFPKGLPIGKVRSIKREKYGLFQEIEITIQANLSRLEEVLVIGK